MLRGVGCVLLPWQAVRVHALQIKPVGRFRLHLQPQGMACDAVRCTWVALELDV